jgi:hypothetical protein
MMRENVTLEVGKVLIGKKIILAKGMAPFENV